MATTTTTSTSTGYILYTLCAQERHIIHTLYHRLNVLWYKTASIIINFIKYFFINIFIKIVFDSLQEW